MRRHRLIERKCPKCGHKLAVEVLDDPITGARRLVYCVWCGYIFEREPKPMGLTRIRFFPRSGARLYIPQKLLDDPSFPFRDGEEVEIRIEGKRLIVRRAETRW